MVANINARKLIEVIKAEIKTKETKIQALQEMIEFSWRKDKRSGIDALCFNEFTHVYKRTIQPLNRM